MLVFLCLFFTYGLSFIVLKRVLLLLALLLLYSLLCVFIWRDIIFVTIWIWLPFLGLGPTRHAVVLLNIVVRRWHFVLRWTLSLTFHIVLDIFIFNLSLTFDEKDVKEVLEEQWLLIRISCHLTPKIIHVLSGGNIDAWKIGVEKQHPTYKYKGGHTD